MNSPAHTAIPTLLPSEPENDTRLTQPEELRTGEKPISLLRAPEPLHRPKPALLDRKIIGRNTAQVMAEVRWDGQANKSAYRRLEGGTRPAGLAFVSVNWTGTAEGAPTEHQKNQSVDAVFGAFNWG